jgi:hypothetical protein
LPPHPIVLTANFGEHHVFRPPPNKIGNRKLGNGLETRGYKDDNDGGYIIAAGSKLPDGRCWRLANGSPSLLTATLPVPAVWLTQYASEQKTEWNGGGVHRQTGNREARYAMTSAITLVRDYFWPHARACLRQIGLSERHTNARRVLRWLKANRKTEVSREDVRRDALAQRLDADETTELLTRLCHSGWLREKTIPSGPQGGKPSRRWLVNPHLRKPTTAETAETAETPQ